MRHLIFISLCSLLWTACGNTDNDFDASGTFEATEILVSSEANGKIMELNIEEGDRLDAGAIVGYVDSTQLFLRKMQLSASLRSVDIRKPLSWNNKSPRLRPSNSDRKTWCVRKRVTKSNWTIS